MDVSKFSSSAVGELQRIWGHDGYLDRDYDHFAFVPAPLPAAVPRQGPTIKLIAEAERAFGLMPLRAGSPIRRCSCVQRSAGKP